MPRLIQALPRAGLLILSLPPVLIGIAVLLSMASGEVNSVTTEAELARRASYPLAMVIHIVGGSAMLILGLVQFAPGLRHKAPRLHRWTGRALLALGAGFALTGLWMNASPLTLPDTQLHDGAQNIMSAVFLAVSALGLAAARRRDYATHRAWMMRAYAIALGAGTQTALLFPVFLLTGEPPQGLPADLVFIAAWVLNLALAEVLIQRPASAPRAATV